jgi:hypothetical protein
MISSTKGKKVDTEITKMLCAFDPTDILEEKMPYFIAVGWDKKIHVWTDAKEEIVETTKSFPKDPTTGH